MNKTQKAEGMTAATPSLAISDAIEDCLGRAIPRLDEMFRLICEARAAYIRARTHHREENYVKSYSCRQDANSKLTHLNRILSGMVDTND